MIKREKLDKLATTAVIDGKCSRGNQREKIYYLRNWLKVGEMADALKVMKERYAWKVMITCAKEKGT